MKTNKHHRKPKAQGGTNSSRNVVRVDAERHALWHRLFDGNRTPESIFKEINELWLDPDYYIRLYKKGS